MSYVLKKVKDGYKICLKSEHKEGGKRETYTEARDREARQQEEFTKKNEEKKATALHRTELQSSIAKKDRNKQRREVIDRQMDTYKRILDSVKERLDSTSADKIIQQYQKDIDKIGSYDFYNISNDGLRDKLDAQYLKMYDNMKNRPRVYGTAPSGNLADPNVIRYVYEHYGQGERNFLDTIASGLEFAVSFGLSKVPVIGDVFEKGMELVHGVIDKEDMPKAGEDTDEVDYSLLDQGLDEQLAKAEVDRPLLEEELAKFQSEEKQIEDQYKLVDTELTPEEIAFKAEDMKGFGKPANKKLYDQITSKVKKDQPKHSLFRSARIQKEYKDAGGTYIGDKPGDKKGIKGWFNSKWISMNSYAHDGEIIPCGKDRTEERYGEYPLCRPLKIAKKIGRTKALKMLKAKDELKGGPLFTEKVLGTPRFNVTKNMVGDAKPLTARLGGKVLLKKDIVEKFFPATSTYSTYVEPFVGGGSVYFYKDKDDHKEIVNDLDPLIYTIFKGFQKYPAERISQAVTGDYNKNDFTKIVDSAPRDEFGKFIRMFIINRISYFAKSKAFGKPRINTSFEGYQDRLKDTIILKKDWKSVIKKYNVGTETFFYLDPPLSKSDSSFEYDPIDITVLKKVCDDIDDQGNKFLLSLTDIDIEAFKAYNTNKISAKYVGRRTRGGQKELVNGYIISNYDIGVSGSGKFGDSDEKKQLERGEKTSDAFIKQLEKLQFQPEDYLNVAKMLAKKRGYDPNKLSFASDGDHKLLYDSPEGLRKFGKVGYGDFIIWSYLERMGKVPEGTAKKKQNTFHKSHRAMSKEYGLNKYSPNELALSINW